MKILEWPDWARLRAISALGVGQIFAWGSSYYLSAVLAKPIADDTGWPLGWVIAGLSVGLFVSGLVSPWVGRLIDRRGGRPVLAFSAVLLSLGLVSLALATNLILYMGAWIVLGVAMGAGLYDAAFATLGRLYGQSARAAITSLTLWGGFASTTCWPLSAFLLEHGGWRAACFAYAGLHLVLTLPLYLFVVPRQAHGSTRNEPAPAVSPSIAPRIVAPPRGLILILAATINTLGMAISTVISVHLLTILEARDLTLGAAVALGALVGPSQVGARVLQKFLGQRRHPIWTAAASTVLVAAGLATLWSGQPVVGVALVLYGSGIGIASIARGTLPLALFGSDGYAVLMGRLAAPSFLAQAIAPSAGALILETFGASTTLAVLVGLALVNVGVVIALGVVARRFIGGSDRARTSPAGLAASSD